MDRRLTPANDRVAAIALKGQVDAPRFVDGWAQGVVLPVVDLFKTPKGTRDRQLLLGTTVTVFEDVEGWSFAQSNLDGYVGYVPTYALGDPVDVSHRVATPATHAYEADTFKSKNLMHLPFGAQVQVLDERAKFFETPHGFVPKKHLRSLALPFTDPVTVAQLHFGTPYLWGGNSTLGIDCSGLVQAALGACDIPCPGDSDMQQAALGHDIATDAPLQRGDLLFWKGHVGMMVDADTLLHANAHHMAVAYEPVNAAILRIKAQGDGDVTARKRL